MWWGRGIGVRDGRERGHERKGSGRERTRSVWGNDRRGDVLPGCLWREEEDMSQRSTKGPKRGEGEDGAEGGAHHKGMHGTGGDGETFFVVRCACGTKERVAQVRARLFRNSG